MSLSSYFFDHQTTSFSLFKFSHVRSERRKRRSAQRQVLKTWSARTRTRRKPCRRVSGRSRCDLSPRVNEVSFPSAGRTPLFRSSHFDLVMQCGGEGLPSVQCVPQWLCTRRVLLTAHRDHEVGTGALSFCSCGAQDPERSHGRVVAPGRVALLLGASSRTPKGCGSDFQS